MALSSNTTFILGRKGTGKSTIFSKAQSATRNIGKNVSIYVDVKALYDLLGEASVPISKIEDGVPEICRRDLAQRPFRPLL